MSDTNPIRRMEVPIIVQLGERQMSVGEVSELAPGSIIELPKRVEEELHLLVSNKPIGLGTAVKIGENFGIQITFIGELRTRLAAATSFMIGDSEGESVPMPDGEMAEQMLAGQL